MRFGIGRGVESDADDDTRLGAVSQGLEMIDAGSLCSRKS